MTLTRQRYFLHTVRVIKSIWITCQKFLFTELGTWLWLQCCCGHNTIDDECFTNGLDNFQVCLCPDSLHALVSTLVNKRFQLFVSCITRHYNKDERMVPLMERIAWELAERVSRVINVRTIFRESPDEVPIFVKEYLNQHLPDGMIVLL